METYLENETYDRLIDALATLPPCIFTGGVDLCALKLALGEIGDIWPIRIRPDPVRADQE